MNKSEISAELFRDNLFRLYQKGASHAEICIYIGAYCSDLTPAWTIHREHCLTLVADLKAKYRLD